MQRCRPSIIHVIQTQVFLYPNKVEQGRWLISLRRNMEHISSIHIPQLVVCVHLVTQNLNQFKITVKRRKMQCRKLFVSRCVWPNLECFRHRFPIFIQRQIVPTTVLVNNLEAKSVIFESSEGESRVLAWLLNFNDVDSCFGLGKKRSQFEVIVVANVLED